jgi:hypothetical protein
MEFLRAHVRRHLDGYLYRAALTAEPDEVRSSV